MHEPSNRPLYPPKLMRCASRSSINQPAEGSQDCCCIEQLPRRSSELERIIDAIVFMVGLGDLHE